MTTNVIKVALKIQKIIDSCLTEDHLDVCFNMLCQFRRLYVNFNDDLCST